MAVEHSLRRTVRFGVFEADFRAGELRKRGTRVTLQEQPLQVLQALLEHPGEIVTRDQLRQKIWPSNTFVDFEQGLYNAVRRLRDALSDSADRPRFIETISRRGYRFIGKVNAPPREIQSVAVLPLENLSGDPEQEYFGDGFTEALITTLAKIGDLRVVSRTSSMQYKRTLKRVTEIAQELDVDAIVEGTVLRAGRRVRITAQLVDAALETHMWAESYERDLRNVLALQADLAQAIAREIQVKITPADHARLGKIQAIKPDAYDSYLKGRYHWNKGYGLREAIQCFEQAIASAPDFAAAYAGLSDCFTALTAWGHVSADEGAVKGKRLAQRAIEIDPGQADAHAALALSTMYEYDFLAAEREFERAVELNPHSATAHHTYGFYLGVIGRYEESYTELQRALRMDPLSGLVNAFLGYIFLYAKRYDQAVEQFTKTLRLDPTSAPAQGGLGWAYRCKSLFGPAIAAAQKAVELWRRGSSPLAWLGETYAAAGCATEARKTLEQLQQISKERYVTPYGIARIYATLGNKDEALQWLEIAYQKRAEWMVLLRVDPSLDDLRLDPRFQDLLRRINFPPN